MSHIATVKCMITDLDALEAAAEALDAQVMRGQKTFRSYQPGLHCEHALRLKDNPQAYEVGLTPRTDGQPGWNLAFDSWGNGAALVQKLGPDLVNLQNGYLAVVAERQLQRGGYRVVREATPTGIRVRAVQ